MKRRMSETVSKLKTLMNMLKNDSESSLLQLPSVGPKSVEKILEMRASVQGPLRMSDVHVALSTGIKKYICAEDPSAMDIVNFLTYYEAKFSMDEQSQNTVRNVFNAHLVSTYTLTLHCAVLSGEGRLH